MTNILSRTLDKWTDSEITTVKRSAIFVENRIATRQLVKARGITLLGFLVAIIFFIGTDPWTEHYWFIHELFSIGAIFYIFVMIAIGYWFWVQTKKSWKMVGL
jgi:protein-S-isoprenylcysteine O-methyltransferase Ste14